MNRLELKYGCNPNQRPAQIFMAEGELPIEVLCGRPGYINFMDALNSWQLVKELREATGLPSAASFKHVSPAGAAVGLPLNAEDSAVFFAPADKELTPIARAYIRARGADRLCSYGDWAALSETCDEATALYLKNEVSDGIIAPDYSPEALEILREKKGGRYSIVRIDPEYVPAPVERRDIFGVTFQQGRNEQRIDRALVQNIVTENRELPERAAEDLLLSLITLKYTQSNSVCYAKDGQTLGVGAGGQSRIQCTRMAGDKADRWYLRRHPKALGLSFLPSLKRAERDNAIDAYTSGECEGLLAEGKWQSIFAKKPEPLTADERRDWIAGQSSVCVGSDAFFPFGDNIERARSSGVRYVAQPGGSIRDDDVIAAANSCGMVMCFTGARLFHH